jgi:hypothetical protein
MAVEHDETETQPTDGVWAFSNGTEFMYWQGMNCNRCTKNYDYDTNEYHCDLLRAIDDAGASNGRVPDAEAQRLGWKGDGGQHGLCPELELLESRS